MKTVTTKRLVSYYVVPVVGTVTFIVILLTLKWWEQMIPPPGLRYLTLGLLFFTIIYITNRLVDRYIRTIRRDKYLRGL